MPLMRYIARQGFTLVELMVVIGLMAVLTLFAIPAFQEANRGGRARTAIFQLHTAMSLARQTAVTTRQNVHIMFPEDSSSISQINYNPETIALAYRAYAVFGARDGYVGDWRPLPEGVVFHADLDITFPGESGFANVFRQTNTNFVKWVTFPDQGSSENAGILSLTYRPDGALDHAGFSRRGAYITEGFVVSEGSTVQDLVFRPNASIFGLEIRPESGQARAREYNP